MSDQLAVPPARATPAGTGTGLERSALGKVTLRLAPFLALMFFVNDLDRTAIASAAPNGMNQRLGLSAS